MRIGIDAKRLFFNYTGLGNYGRQFVHALLEHKKNTDKFVLFSPKSIKKSDYSKEFQQHEIDVVLPSGWKKWFNGALWRTFFLSKELAQNQFAAFYGISNELPFGIHKFSLKKAVIIHDLIFLRFPNLYPRLDVLFYKIKTKYAVKVADQIIAVSEQTKQDLIEFYRVPKENITVIPPVCDKIYFSESINFDKIFERKYLLNVGSITPRKNLLLAIQAYSKLHNKYDMDFVIIGTAVGEGKIYLQKIKQFIKENGLENRVHFMGKMDKKLMPGIYKNAQFMVYPSQFEGFGMPIAESLFCKTPVITSTGSCFAEAGGPGAIYTAPNNLEELTAAMEKLTNDDALRTSLGEAGFQHVQQFREEKIGQKIADFHQKLMNDCTK